MASAVDTSPPDDAARALDPSAGPEGFDSLGRVNFAPAESELFYREECKNNGVHPNNTFVKQLLAGVTVFDFDNGYLGERGIIPVLSTLRRLPVVELSMRNCELTTEDVSLIQKTFASHDTFRKIDLRGVPLTVAAARKLLTLAVQNSHVTEILLDASTPKYLYIQKQCFSNANASTLASRCLVCSKPVIHSLDQRVEGRLLLSLGEEISRMAPETTGVAIQAMLRCVMACCEVADGVLFLCSSECRLRLTNDIITAVRAVVCDTFTCEKVVYPKNSILRRFVEDALKTPMGILPKPKTRSNGDAACIAVGNKTEVNENTNDSNHNSNNYGRDEDDSDDSEDNETRKTSNAVLEQCTICGRYAACLLNGGLLAMQQICKDIEEGFVLRPSALLRLVKLMISYADMRPCSNECVTHLVRFGMYGYGGVLQSDGRKKDPTVASLDIPLTYLPNEDFAIISFSLTYIDELDEEDTTCALTVASAMSDMNGVTIDPYMIFAFGRHLEKLPSHVLGMELRQACEAVHIVGCLPANLGPFDRRKERPPRRYYVSWEKWNEHTDVNNIVHVAFSRRQQGVYVIDGPHGNLFDNTRAALWAFRKQRRAVLVSMRFSMDWLLLPGGVILNETPLGRSFLTTLKVVGQTNIDNNFYVICQGNFGSQVGNHGIFYIPRGIFNLYTIGHAYIFLDAGVCMNSRGHKLNLYASRVLPKKVLDLVENIPLLQEMYHFCIEVLNWKTRHQLDYSKSVCEALCHLPPAIFFIYRGCEHDISETQIELLKTLRRLIFMDNSRSLLLFYLYEVLGVRSMEWVHRLVRQLSLYPPIAVLLQKKRECVSSKDAVERRQEQLQWKSVMVEKEPLAKITPQAHVSRVWKKNSFMRLAKNKLPDKKTNKEAKDLFRSKLESRWAMTRERGESVRETERASRDDGYLGRHHFIRASATGSRFKALSLALNNDTIPSTLVGHSWHSIRLTEKDGKLSDYVMFFIRDHVCCFNFNNHTIVEPLHPILESRFASCFPFVTGFDCALNSPVNPRKAYFFCGEQWMEWDTYYQTCTGGPYKLQVHRQFEALPQEFIHRIDAAVPIPNTSYVFFFSQLMYVVFDLEQRMPVGDVSRIGDTKAGKKDLPVFNAELAKIFPYGPMTTLLQRAKDKLEWDKTSAATAKSEENEENNKDGNSSLEKNSDQVENLRVTLIGKNGRLAIISNFLMSSMTKETKDILKTLPSSSFSRLPLALQQMTTAALHGICKRALDAECNRCGVVLNTAYQENYQVHAITSTLTQQREESCGILSLTRHDVSYTNTSLLCEEVVFVQTEESMLDTPPQVVEIDYGSTYPVAFGALVAVLDTASIDPRVLLVAPIEAAVESSDDGVIYMMHTRFILTPYVTPVCWGDTHAARFWRIRFLSRLPVNTGIVRLLWYEVLCALGAIPLNPSVPFIPHVSTTVSITAPRILYKPADLLNNLVPGAVFESSPNDGWFKKHCILPLLPEGRFCLLFSGKNFVELDVEHNIIISHRTIPLASHPCFVNLPFPFSNGFDSVFYPDLQNPDVVALVHGKDIILWNFLLGCNETNSNSNPELFFKGMPWNMEHIEDIVQIWDSPGEFFIIQSPYVLRWSIVTQEIKEGPLMLRECPHFYHSEFDGKPLLSVMSFPNKPKCYYVFCEDKVASKTISNGTTTEYRKPTSVYQFDLFSPVTWYLNWGKKRYDTAIHIDFREEQPLLTGIAMRSLEPCDEKWFIEYSDDGVVWKAVGYHHQSSGLSRSMWDLASVEHTSHRLWRLSATAMKKHSAENQSVLYMNLHFFTLPSTLYVRPVKKIALSGTLNGPVSALFMKEKATVAFESAIETSKEHEPVTHHITLDYGNINSPTLMAFSCQCSGSPVGVIWSTWCSDDGDHWEQCGMWRSRFLYFKASWKPRACRRYWRIELQTWEPNVLFEDFSLYEYVGPSILLENSVLEGDDWDPSLLWRKNTIGCKVSPITFSAHIGTSLIFDNRQGLTHVVGACVTMHEEQKTSTTFVVECSSDAIQWRSLNVSLLLREGSAQVAWENGDYYRFWRLRIVQHSGPPILMIRDICFETSKPKLYHLVSPHNNNNNNNNEMGDNNDWELDLGVDLKEIVAVQAILPPNSTYVVEKLSLDGAAWEEIAMVQNSDPRHTRTVRQGWMPRGCSSNWRLRPAEVDVGKNNDGGNVMMYFPNITGIVKGAVNVQWYTYSGTTLTSAKIGDISSMEVSTTGFIEVQSVKHLTENQTDTVVLRSMDYCKSADVTWSCKNGSMPRFQQVLLSGRLVMNYMTSASQSTTLQSELSSNANSLRFGKKSSGANGVSVSGKGNAKLDKNRGKRKEEEEEEEKEEGSWITIVVEGSDNGIDYVPVAERCFSQNGNSLSWQMSVGSSFWRIRFEGIRETERLELRRVTWFVECGIATSSAPQESHMITRTVYTTWQEAAYNHEEEFCRKCREGFDQARSVASGLRTAGDIEQHGRVAERVMRLRNEFMNFAAKISKDARKKEPPPEDKFISIGKPLNNDIMYLLYRASVKYNCNVDELNELVAHPMLISRDCARSSDNMSWFYPKFDQSGTLVESFYGFHNVRASLSVLWSLSLQIQRNTDLLYDSSITPLNPHLASVIITVHIGRNNWIAAEHFPHLPLLYYAGFTERPVVIVFALNQVTFTSKYNLTIPGTDPFPAVFPFKIHAGVNFIQRIPLTACPCPLFDSLQLIYSKEFLSKYETEVVFTSPSMRSQVGVVRFTLPGDNINFGIHGLTIGSIQFEVQLQVEGDMEEERDMTMNNNNNNNNNNNEQKSLGEQFQRVTFVTYDTLYRGPNDSSPMHVSLVGSFNLTEDKIIIRGVSPSAHLSAPSAFKDGFLTNLRLSFELVSGETPQTFIEPFLTIEGTLTTPNCGSYDCCFSQVRLHGSHESLSLQIVNLQLIKLIKLGSYMMKNLIQNYNMDWLSGIHMIFSTNIQMRYHEPRAFGSGSIEFLGFRGDSYVIISPEGIGVTATFPFLRIGNIFMQGKSNKHGVVMNIVTSTNNACILRLDGYGSILAPCPYPIHVEISEKGVLCVSTGVFYDLCIEEESFFPSAVYAQVRISKNIITNTLSELLQETPMILAFLSKGIPFSFEVEEVVAEDCFLERQLLFITVRGVLFGCRFDVTASVVRPDNTLEEARRICEVLLPRIVEQCDASLWASYEMLAGYLLLQDTPEGEGESAAEGKGKNNSDDNNDSNNNNVKKSFQTGGTHPALERHLLRSPYGKFIGHWISSECEVLDKDMQDDFETVAREETKRSWNEFSKAI